jgi:hypothetical protein
VPIIDVLDDDRNTLQFTNGYHTAETPPAPCVDNDIIICDEDDLDTRPTTSTGVFTSPPPHSFKPPSRYSRTPRNAANPFDLSRPWHVRNTGVERTPQSSSLMESPPPTLHSGSNTRSSSRASEVSKAFHFHTTFNSFIRSIWKNAHDMINFCD